jgi:hypothetical protein
MVKTTGPKVINIKLSNEAHMKIKLQATKERTTIKELVERVMASYCDKNGGSN